MRPQICLDETKAASRRANQSLRACRLMFSRVAILGFSAALTALVAGCEDANRQSSTLLADSPSAVAASIPAVAAPQFTFRHDALRNTADVFLDDGSGSPQRVRTLNTPPGGWNDAEQERRRTQEAAAHAPWQACIERVRRPQPTAEDRHDAWLEACAKLEAALAADPAHLLIQRDLLNAEITLLGYERDSPFAASVCRSACDRLVAYVRDTHPAEPSEAAFAVTAEAWLYFHKRVYPAAAESLKRIPDPEARRSLTDALETIQQRRFLPLETWTVDRCTVRAYRTVGGSPDADLVWPECHFVIAPTEAPAAPARTMSYTLGAYGAGDERRFYLRFHSFGDAELVLMYGAERPSYSLVKQQIGELIRADAAEVRVVVVTGGAAR